MNYGISTAEDLFSAMKEMPSGERIRFFTLLGENVFERASCKTPIVDLIFRIDLRNLKVRAAISGMM